MKLTDKKKPIRTIPEGAWESGSYSEGPEISEKKRLNEITTDYQGNGYPLSNKHRH